MVCQHICGPEKEGPRTARFSLQQAQNLACRSLTLSILNNFFVLLKEQSRSSRHMPLHARSIDGISPPQVLPAPYRVCAVCLVSVLEVVHRLDPDTVSNLTTKSNLTQ